MDITPKLAEARRLLDGDAPKPAARQAIGALAAMGLLAGEYARRRDRLMENPAP